jgi:RNA polymerase sigma-70 factor (ECF subfamily)
MAVNITLEADEELAWRATQEVEAFEELYRRYKLTIYRYHLAQTGSEQVAQDLMAQTFLAAFESINSYDFRGRFVSWLFRIANKIQEEHHHRWDFSTPQFTTPGFPDNVAKPGRGAAYQIEIHEIAKAIDTLTEDEAEALTLRFFAGLNSSEIGQIMDKSETAVKILVYRGLCDLLDRSLA